MKLFTPDTTIAELLTDMVTDGQAISMVTMSIRPVMEVDGEEKEGPHIDFLIVTAIPPYSESVKEIIQRIGKSSGADSREVRYGFDQDGKLIPNLERPHGETESHKGP